MERFWSKVQRGASHECWPWTASVNARGYGTFGFEGRTQSAHRVAYKLSRGEITGSAVCHTCDNKLCCNPDHLYDGSDADNVRDAVERGQHPRGERHGRAKLTEDDIRAMRRAYNDGVFIKDLADQYGVSDVTAGRVVHRRIWKHVE